MNDADDRIETMQSQLRSLETTLEKRHAFALQVFSCVIDLYALSVHLYDNMTDMAEKQRFREALSTLAESVNEAQKMSNAIVAPLNQGGPSGG